MLVWVYLCVIGHKGVHEKYRGLSMSSIHRKQHDTEGLLYDLQESQTSLRRRDRQLNVP